MPDVVKEILENYYMWNPEKIFPFRTLKSGDVCYALYCKGKIEDNVPWKIKRKYRKMAGKNNILIWKLPKTLKNFPKRIGYSFKEGLPSSEESFYNFIYVFAPEIDSETVAEEFKVEFSEEKDDMLILQAEDLG